MSREYECGFTGADGKREVIDECPADPVPSAKSGSESGPQSHGQGLEACLIPLLKAMAEQTAAINRLASSNEALVQAMAASEGMDEDSPSAPQYLGRAR